MNNKRGTINCIFVITTPQSSAACQIKLPPDSKDIGFNLTASGDYDMKNKKIYPLDTPDNQKVDDDYNTMVQDLKSAERYYDGLFFR